MNPDAVEWLESGYDQWVRDRRRVLLGQLAVATDKAMEYREMFRPLRDAGFARIKLDHEMVQGNGLCHKCLRTKDLIVVE